MKRALWVLAILLCASAPVWAGSVGLSAAYQDTDEAKDETGVTLEFAFDLSRRVDLQIRGTYLKELTTEFESRLGTHEVDIRYYPLDLGLAVHFIPDARVSPYVSGGLTHYSVSSDLEDIGLESGHIEAELGYYGGFGVDFTLVRHWALYFNALYRVGQARLTGEGLQGFSQRGLDLSGAGGNLGVKVSW